jgi:alkylhydroperoxidase family enzyme
VALEVVSVPYTSDAVTTRYDELIRRLRDSALPERVPPSEMAGYLDKVRLHAYKVTDRDVEELKEAGFSEDEIFEHTISAAVAAGLERLDKGLGTIR